MKKIIFFALIGMVGSLSGYARETLSVQQPEKAVCRLGAVNSADKNTGEDISKAIYDYSKQVQITGLAGTHEPIFSSAPKDGAIGYARTVEFDLTGLHGTKESVAEYGISISKDVSIQLGGGPGGMSQRGGCPFLELKTTVQEKVQRLSLTCDRASSDSMLTVVFTALKEPLTQLNGMYVYPYLVCEVHYAKKAEKESEANVKNLKSENKSNSSGNKKETNGDSVH